MASKARIVVHGGAWAIPDELVERSISGVQIAAQTAWKILENGGISLDAVEAAVVVLENDPAFDAGTGSVLTADGTVEMDAIIMNGERLQVGAVACVENIKNPIQLARKVMETTEHILLVGKGANAFAEEIGIPRVTTKSLVTPEAVESLEVYKKFNSTVSSLFSERSALIAGHDTVGCVALDKFGHLSSATSTGGITAKKPGRVGDSPLIGCGAYADDESCAVSCTGHGESIAKVCLARRVCQQFEQGASAQEAVDSSLAFMSKRLGGAGGIICVSRNGEIGIGFNSERMPWCSISEDSVNFGINPSADKKPGNQNCIDKH